MNLNKPPIYVTEPFLPPLEEFIPYLAQIWENRRLTNNGPLHQQLEEKLCAYLGVEHIALFTNGTIALITALKTQSITGEVITTPYSFVATSHALLWNDIKPVFVDIDPNTFNINPEKIEEEITPQTTAILAVHCYGNPCAVERIQQIAHTHGLKVIYDAAHAFGVKYKGESLLKHGDLSVLSFHATKVFNTFEGGAIICPDAKTKQYIDRVKNFGFKDELTVTTAGINGKMSEINAAFGLLQLKHIDNVIERRRKIIEYYLEKLSDVVGVTVFNIASESEGNGSYFPILIEKNYPITRDKLYNRFKEHNIFARRYFYPLISDFPIYRRLFSVNDNKLLHAKNIAEKVLCLPIYPTMSESDIDAISRIVIGY